MATKTKAKTKPAVKQKARPGQPRILSVLLWTTVFLLILAGIDQLLVRVPASHPAHVAVAGFYRDLRGRVLGLGQAAKPSPATPTKAKAAEKPKPAAPPASIEAVIDRHQAKTATSTKSAVPAKAPPSPVKPATKEKPAVTAKPVPPASVKPAVAAPAKPGAAEPPVAAKPPLPAAKPVAPAPLPGEPKPRYSYVDEQGRQFFADTLAEVPEQFRGVAKRLGE